MAEIGSKTHITDIERLELASKLDRELEDFISGLERKRYTEGWPEDRWQEEMDKHPFFMKKPPEPGDEVHPLFEGLQKLKYDPEENTAYDLALNYKEDGNFYLKHKKYRMGVYSFTEGLKAKSKDSEIDSILYNNRSASHFFLKNYRSSLADAQKALELRPDYAKPRWRAAQCAYEINKFNLCIQYCEEILENDPANPQTKILMKKCKSKMLELERDERKSTADAKKKLSEFNRTLNALITRGVKFDEIKQGSAITAEVLKPPFLPLEDHPVHLDDDGDMIWPVAFSYPEFMLSDFHQQLNENAIMEDVVTLLFAAPLPSDKENKYEPGKVRMYYENRKAGTVCKVNLKKRIGAIIKENDFYVRGGSLLFYVVPANSQIEKDFLNETRRPMVYS